MASLNKLYQEHWLAIDPAQHPRLQGVDLKIGEIYNPYQMEATEFYKEASDLRADLFIMRSEIKGVMKLIEEKYKIYDSKLDEWLNSTQFSLKRLTEQIDALEAGSIKSNKFVIFSRWAVKTIRDGASWDVMKFFIMEIKKFVENFL